MSIWYFIKLSFLLVYTSICAYLAYIMYNHEKVYYEPIYVLKKTGKGKDDEKRVYLHDEFDEFTRRDKPVSYIKLFIGTFTLFFFKLFSSFFFAISLSRKLYNQLKKKEDKKEPFTKEEIKENVENTKSHATNFLRFSGIFFKKLRLPDEKV